MSYLSRYEAGDHDAVWDELRRVELGANPALDDEARAVTELLIGRARYNLERIASNLTGIGYAFEINPDDGSIPLSHSVSFAQTTAATVLAGLNSKGLPSEDAEMIRAMAAQLQQMADRASGPMPTFPGIPGPGAKGVQRPLGDNGISIPNVEEFERKVCKLPLALAAFWKKIGHADFVGVFHGRRTSGWLPLLVLPCLGLIEEHEEFVDDNGSGDDFTVELVANPKDQNNPLGVYLTPGVDAKLTSGEWFVDYLRRGTRSAGFLSIPEADMPAEIAAIAKAWEPF